jgi:methyl-accepting chemotaxis protein
MRRRLHVKILLLVATTLAIALGLNTWISVEYFAARYRTALLGKLGVVGGDLQRSLARTLDLGLKLEELSGVADQVKQLKESYPEVGYVAVLGVSGRLLYSSAGGGPAADELAAVLARTPEVPLDAGGARVAWRGGELFDVSLPLVQSAQGGAGGAPGRAGTIRMGLRADVPAAEVRAIWTRSLAIGAAVLVAATVIGFLLVSFAVSRPIFHLAQTAERLAAGNLTERAREAGDDELAALGRAFNRMAERLQGLLRKIHAASASVASASDTISGSSASVLGDAKAQAGSVEETSRSVSTMNASVADILASIDRLTHAAQGSSSSILEMGATIEEVATNMEYLATSVEQTTASVEEVAAASREVAGSVETLMGLTKETASSVQEFEQMIREVEENARQTSALSEKVQADADLGMRAVGVTIEGIARIEESASRASGAIVGLSERIRNIDSILAIIDDVAEETNLLALNAAIIAAQAGGHGRGFGVVADEIRDLAERTGASTKQIADQVQRVQADASLAVEVMKAGGASIDEGVRLAKEAGAALAQIAQSASRSVERVRGIAAATAEQSRSSRQMTDAIGRIAAMTHRIGLATKEQSRGGEQILQAVEKMREIAQQVKQTTGEQAKGSRHITRAIEEMTEMILQINRATAEHGDSSRRLEEAIGRIKGTMQSNLTSAAGLNDVVGALGRQARILRDEVERFRV